MAVSNVASSQRDILAKKRSDLFSKEKQRQLDLIPRIDKIEVMYKGVPEDVTLYLNKNLSTPFNIAQRKVKHYFSAVSNVAIFADISEVLTDRAALAKVNEALWDLHRPLEGNSTVELLHFHDQDPFHLNRAFWRSCSFLLGYACESVFSDRIPLQLHSFPPPNGNFY